MYKKYSCETCNYYTTTRSNYFKHLNTRKHILCNDENIIDYTLKENTINFNPIIEYKNKKQLIVECSICLKSYSCRQSLYTHLKNCKKKNDSVSQNNSSNYEDLSTSTTSQKVVIDKELLIELLKKISSSENSVIQPINTNSHNNINITNNNTNSNNKFCLNFFLNEQCKDASNIQDFLDNLNTTFHDLENIGSNGFVQGITQIIQNKLSEYNLYTRPIHCTDIKRDVLYIKDNDKWEKDEHGNPKMRNVIEKIADKNIRKVSAWRDEHPNCSVLDSNDYNKWLSIAKQSLNSGADSKKNEDKIIKNISNISDISEIRTIGMEESHKNSIKKL